MRHTQQYFVKQVYKACIIRFFTLRYLRSQLQMLSAQRKCKAIMKPYKFCSNNCQNGRQSPRPRTETLEVPKESTRERKGSLRYIFPVRWPGGNLKSLVEIRIPSGWKRRQKEEGGPDKGLKQPQDRIPMRKPALPSPSELGCFNVPWTWL